MRRPSRGVSLIGLLSILACDKPSEVTFTPEHASTEEAAVLSREQVRKTRAEVCEEVRAGYGELEKLQLEVAIQAAPAEQVSLATKRAELVNGAIDDNFVQACLDVPDESYEALANFAAYAEGLAAARRALFECRARGAASCRQWSDELRAVERRYPDCAGAIRQIVGLAWTRGGPGVEEALGASYRPSLVDEGEDAESGNFGGRGKLVARVRQAKHTVTGPLDADIIRRIVKSHLNQVRDCYNAGLRKDPWLEGRVTVEFTISGPGKVSSSSALRPDDFGDPTVPKCIAKAVERWKFPKPQGGADVVVSYPFELYVD